jgi:hypothetical protein
LHPVNGTGARQARRRDNLLKNSLNSADFANFPLSSGNRTPSWIPSGQPEANFGAKGGRE